MGYLASDAVGSEHGNSDLFVGPHRVARFFVWVRVTPHGEEYRVSGSMGLRAGAAALRGNIPVVPFLGIVSCCLQ
jgi:hypothetical protein